jgi:hypothetical protein
MAAMAAMAAPADMVRNRSAVLNVKEKAYLKQVRNLLIFESGACVTARKYSKIDNIQTVSISMREESRS